jgi:hypothetical protein
MLRVLQSLYRKVKSCVKVEEGLFSSWFDLEVGLRQGCPLSPILFILFIDGLARAVKEWANKDRKRGILGVSILLFADDIVLLAKDNKELQSLLAVVYAYSTKWNFRFNIDKSKIMIFGHRSGLDHPLFLGSNRLGLSQIVKYLGVEPDPSC